MNIQQIRYVLAVARQLNFGQAAEQCHVTQSTLSTMIARLEDELGLLIFDRKTKPVSITKEGAKVISQMKIIDKELDTLQEVVGGIKNEMTGEIKIGAIPTVAPYLFPLFLNDFIHHFPKINFEISETPTEKIVKNLLDRDLDIGIVSIPLNVKSIREIHLYDEPFLLFDKAENKKNKTQYRIEEIELDRLWLLEEGHCMRTQVESICDLRQQRKIGKNLVYKSGSIDTLLKLVTKNKGITLLPKLASLDLPKTEQEQLKEFIAPTPVRSIGIIVHEHFVKDKIVELLQKEIQKHSIPLIGKLGPEKEIIFPV